MEDYLGLLIWNFLPDTLEAKQSFQTFKSPPCDWFGPKYKCKVVSYMDNTKMVLRSRLNLGFFSTAGFYFKRKVLKGSH